MTSKPDEPWCWLRSTDGTIGLALHRFAGNGPAHSTATRLLISHATGFHAHCYRPLADQLPSDWVVVGIDHRGHGYTAPDPAARSVPPDIETVPWGPFGDDTVTAAAWLHGDAGTSDNETGDPGTGDDGTGVVGFGHSMGGASLLLAAAARPDLFRQLILFEPIAPYDMVGVSGPSDLATGARRRRRTFESMDAAIANYSAKPPMSLMTEDSLREYVRHGFGETTDGVTLRCTPEFESATFDGAATNGVWDILPDVITPTVVIAGAPNGIPAEIAPGIAERLPNSEFVEFDDQTHFGPFSHPDVVAAAIIAQVNALR